MRFYSNFDHVMNMPKAAKVTQLMRIDPSQLPIQLECSIFFVNSSTSVLTYMCFYFDVYFQIAF